MSTDTPNEDSPQKEFKKLDHAWQIYLNTQDIIKYADQKVHVLIVLGTIITGAVLTQMDTLLRELLLNRLLIFSFFISTGAFLTTALLALLARFDMKSDSNIPKLVFFRHIQMRSSALDYANSFQETSETEALKDLCYQIYEVSVITESKFKYYRAACVALLAQMIVFLLIFYRISL